MCRKKSQERKSCVAETRIFEWVGSIARRNTLQMKKYEEQFGYQEYLERSKRKGCRSMVIYRER